MNGKKEEREQERKRKEDERENKRLERENKRKEEERRRTERTRGGSRGRGRGQGRGWGSQGNSHQVDSHSSSLSDTSSEGCLCGVCNTHNDGNWVQCDKCTDWFHYACVDLEEDASIRDIEWLCDNCC